MSRTQDQLRGDYERLFPGQDWNQRCQAVVAHAAEFTTGNVRFYLTAKDAYKASKIVSLKASKAVRNDVHYWAIGVDWHVGVDLGGGQVLMGTKHTDGSWGRNLGETTVAAYTRATGAVYKGFAHTNGVNRIAIVTSPPAAAAAGSAEIKRVGKFLNAQHLGKTTKAAENGIADHTGTVATAYAWLIQAWLIKQGRYPQPQYKHDGKFARVGGLTRQGEAEINALVLAAEK